MTLARTVADAEEVTSWLRKEFGKNKFFLLAHSAGSSVGLRMAERHPDCLYPTLAWARWPTYPRANAGVGDL